MEDRRRKRVTTDITQRDVHRFTQGLAPTARPVDPFVAPNQNTGVGELAKILGYAQQGLQAATQFKQAQYDPQEGIAEFNRQAQEYAEGIRTEFEVPTKDEGLKGFFTNQKGKIDGYLHAAGKRRGLDKSLELDKLARNNPEAYEEAYQEAVREGQAFSNNPVFQEQFMNMLNSRRVSHLNMINEAARERDVANYTREVKGLFEGFLTEFQSGFIDDETGDVYNAADLLDNPEARDLHALRGGPTEVDVKSFRKALSNSRKEIKRLYPGIDPSALSGPIVNDIANRAKLYGDESLLKLLDEKDESGHTLWSLVNDPAKLRKDVQDRDQELDKRAEAMAEKKSLEAMDDLALQHDEYVSVLSDPSNTPEEMADAERNAINLEGAIRRDESIPPSVRFEKVRQLRQQRSTYANIARNRETSENILRSSQIQDQIANGTLSSREMLFNQAGSFNLTTSQLGELNSSLSSKEALDTQASHTAVKSGTLLEINEIFAPDLVEDYDIPSDALIQPAKIGDLTSVDTTLQRQQVVSTFYNRYGANLESRANKILGLRLQSLKPREGEKYVRPEDMQKVSDEVLKDFRERRDRAFKAYVEEIRSGKTAIEQAESQAETPEVTQRGLIPEVLEAAEVQAVDVRSDIAQGKIKEAKEKAAKVSSTTPLTIGELNDLGLTYDPDSVGTGPVYSRQMTLRRLTELAEEGDSKTFNSLLESVEEAERDILLTRLSEANINLPELEGVSDLTDQGEQELTLPQ